jgi:capsular polysaccharide transport system permease protein
MSTAIAALKNSDAGTSPERLLILAESCFHIGAWGQAKGYIENLERFQRFHVHARILRARVLLREGAVTEAEAVVDQLAGERGGMAVPADLAVGVARRMIAREGRAAALSFLAAVNWAGNIDLLRVHVGLLAQARRFESAAELVARALGRLPRQERQPFWIMLARIRALMGEFERAKTCLVQGLDPSFPIDWKTLYRAARIAERGGALRAAALWSTRALLEGAHCAAAVTLAARVRIAIDNYDGAIVLLREGLARRYDAGHHFLLARALLASGKFDAACAELSDLVDLYPSNWQARVLLARLLIRLDRESEAICEVEDLIEEFPAIPEVQQLQEQLNVERMELGKAREVAVRENDMASLTGFREESTDFALRDPHVRAILERPTPELFQPCWTESSLKQKGSDLRALKSMGSIVWALLVRETRTRFGESKLGYLWALVEPSIFIGVLILVWVMMGTHYLFGMSITLFIVTGFLPFSFYSTSYARLIGLIHASSSMLFHPQIKPLDLVLARGLLEFATQLVIFALFLGGVALSGERIHIANPLVLLTCLVCLWMSGIGLALFFESVSRIWHSTKVIGSALSRKLFFSSGIFWAPQMLPGWVAKIFLYNPLLHLVELSRAQFTPLIWQHDLSLTYGVCWSVGLLFLGMMASVSLREEVLAR